MKPTDQVTQKFQEAYFEEFGEQISREEAHEKFLRLINFLRVILRPRIQESEDIKPPGPISCGEIDQRPRDDRLKYYNYH